MILLNFARIVSGGIVVFFPSYRLLHNMMAVWREQSLLKSIGQKKRDSDTFFHVNVLSLTDRLTIVHKIFLEPTSTIDVSTVLHEYSTEIREVWNYVALSYLN